MLIALAIAFVGSLFGGGGVATLFSNIGESELEDAISDADTRARIVELSEKHGERLEETSGQLTEQLELFGKLCGAHGSSRADFSASELEFERLFVARHESALATRSAMKALMTEQQWNAVFSER